MLLTIPIPNSELATNKSKGWHYGKHAAMRKKAREDGYYLAREYYQKNINRSFNYFYKSNIEGKWGLIISVFYKNNVHLDDDNLLSALKPMRDGIFDFLKEKFNMNDKQIVLTILKTDYIDKINPHIDLELTPRWLILEV